MKKYRSMDGKDKRLELASGQVTTVGGDWKELPDMFRDEALAKGCLDEEMAKGIAAPVTVDRPEKIKDAITTMIDAEDDEHFNADGSPSVLKVKELCGFNATKDEIATVWAEMLAEADSSSGGDAE